VAGIARRRIERAWRESLAMLDFASAIAWLAFQQAMQAAHLVA
jgi:hypothetical protein